MHWVVYGPSFSFVRNATMGPVIGIDDARTAFLPDESIASTVFNLGDTTFSMIRVDKDGNILARLGPSHNLPGFNHRPFALDGRGGFWVGPPLGPAQGYVIEHWTPHGEVDSKIEREVAWFPADPSYLDINLRPPGDSRVQRGFPFPGINQVRVDGGGRIWVMSSIPTDPGMVSEYIVASPESAALMMQDGVVRVIEVFDPVSGVVLASVQSPYYHNMSLFPDAANLNGIVESGPGYVAGYRVEDDAEGERRVIVMRFILSGASQAGAAVCS